MFQHLINMNGILIAAQRFWWDEPKINWSALVCFPDRTRRPVQHPLSRVLNHFWNTAVINGNAEHQVLTTQETVVCVIKSYCGFLHLGKV